MWKRIALGLVAAVANCDHSLDCRQRAKPSDAVHDHHQAHRDNGFSCVPLGLRLGRDQRHLPHEG